MLIRDRDPFENLSETATLFERKFDLYLDRCERLVVRKLVELIGTRAARLSHTGIAAIVRKKGITEGLVGADGSVFNKYPFFEKRGAQALREILGEEWGSRIKVVPAVDGSGYVSQSLLLCLANAYARSVGAAVIAAMTKARKEKGIFTQY